jgi:hypothetical protein
MVLAFEAVNAALDAWRIGVLLEGLSEIVEL